MRVGIVGIGEWVPETKRGNEAWPPEFVAMHRARTAEFTAVPTNASGDAIDRIVARHSSPEADDPFLGTKSRLVATGITAHEAESSAARAALADARIDPRDIDVVLSSTAVPDRLTPPTAPAVAHRIGAERAYAVGLDAVCASAVAGLEFASALVESGRARHVLLTQSHLMTRAFPMMHPAAPNVGDAATALVVSKVGRGGLLATRIVSNGEYFDAVVWKRPKEADTPWWEPGGTMAMGSYDSERARQLMRDTVRLGVTALREIDAQRVDVLASIQPRAWVPPAIAEGAGMAPECAVETFAERAHLGACGVVVNLLAARGAGRLDAGTRVALYAQGAGFTRAAALLEWS
jgi:3-oxoacyl-[acyl-carrier-protein] synthase-3